jgi:hypothetical protein
MTGKSPDHTVRSDSLWGSQKLLYLAVFAVTGVAVYRWGLAEPQPSKAAKSYISTATIRLRDASQAAADRQKIQQWITSKQNIYRAVRQLGLPARPPADEDPLATATRVSGEVSRSLRVTADGTSVPGELAISVTYKNPSPRYSAELANTLAECYAEDYRTQWERRGEQACAQARQSTDRARQDFLQAKSHLDEFSQEHFGPPRARQPANEDSLPSPRLRGEGPGVRGPAKDPSKGPAGDGHAKPTDAQQGNPQTPATAMPSNAAPVDNPEWVELSGKLAALRQRRAELLTDRTPLHPEVQEIQLQIAALIKQLSTTPRKIAAPSPGEPGAPTAQSSHAQGPATTARGTPGRAAGERAAAARTFQTLEEAADRATEAYLHAVDAERQAWQQRQQKPPIKLDLATPIQVSASHVLPRPSLLLAALAVGLAVAAGVAMISAGAAVQFPLTTIEEARKALPVPIVGTIPEIGPTSRPDVSNRRRHIGRIGLIVGGLTLIAGCLGLLWRAWGG